MCPNDKACDWVYKPLHKRYLCIECGNFIAETELIERHNKYCRLRYIAKIVGGPMDGAIIELRFGVKDMWTDAFQEVMVLGKFNLSVFDGRIVYHYQINMEGDLQLQGLIQHKSKRKRKGD